MRSILTTYRLRSINRFNSEIGLTPREFNLINSNRENVIVRGYNCFPLFAYKIQVEDFRKISLIKHDSVNYPECNCTDRISIANKSFVTSRIQDYVLTLEEAAYMCNMSETLTYASIASSWSGLCFARNIIHVCPKIEWINKCK